MNQNHYFWIWFKENQQHFNNLNSHVLKAYIYWLGWNLDYYAPGLQYVLILSRQDKQRPQLFLIPGNNSELLSHAQTLLNGAINKELWEFSIFSFHGSNQEAFGFGGIIKEITLFPTAHFEPIGYDGSTKMLVEINFKNHLLYFQNNMLVQIHHVLNTCPSLAITNAKELCFIQLANTETENPTKCIQLYEFDFYLETYNKKTSN